MSYADYSRNYALYIDGDIAKLPGGGRKGAAVLCELVPSQIQEPYDPYSDPRFAFNHFQPNQSQIVAMFSGTIKGAEEATRGDNTPPTEGTPTIPEANDDLETQNNANK